MKIDENEVAYNLITHTIDAAEDIHDLLDGLVERTTVDPGSAFQPEVLEALARLKKVNRAAFEGLRARLKRVGCRVKELDEAIAEESGNASGASGRGPTQADILVDLAQMAELFHTPDSTGYADLDINGHRETWPIRAKGFRRWLAHRFFEATQGAPSSEALQSALNVIEAKAHFDAPERIVHIRVGGLDGRLYLDLGDVTWRAVEIDATGWRVIDKHRGTGAHCPRALPLRRCASVFHLPRRRQRHRLRPARRQAAQPRALFPVPALLSPRPCQPERRPVGPDPAPRQQDQATLGW